MQLSSPLRMNLLVGNPIVMLRCRRNETIRLGVFTSLPVAAIDDTEIRTEKSIYRIECRRFSDEA
jgi:hypothetical protein